MLRALLLLAALCLTSGARADGPVKLLPSQGGEVAAAIARTGATFHVVAGLNGGEFSTLYLVESADEGRTWKPPAELAKEAGHISTVRIASTTAGLVVAWHAMFLAENGVWARVRPAGSSRWSERRALGSGVRAPALAISADGTVRAVLTPGPDDPEMRFEYVEHEPISGHQLVKAPGPAGAARESKVLDPELVEAGPVAVWLSVVKEPSEPKRVFWSRSARPELGRWSEAEPVYESQRRGSHLTAAAFGKALAVAYEGRGGLEVLHHPGGKAELADSSFEPQLPASGSSPSLVTRENGLLLAFIRLVADGKMLSVYSSADGSAWKAEGSQDTPVQASGQMRIAASARALVAVIYGQQDGVGVVRASLEK